MKKLIINNFHKIHHSTVIIGPLDWEITLTTETESGDGYYFLLVTDELDMCTIWMSNEMRVEGWVKMIRRWNGHEWTGWADVGKMQNPDEFVRMLGDVVWNLQ
jgi:hypothetical protein